MTTPISRLRTVTERLPFSVDDTQAVNGYFQKCREEADPEAERVVDMWTYCYVCRYFLTKSAGDALRSAAAPAALISRTYEKIQENREGVRDPSRYANWVSVVCKNTFLNHKRRNRKEESIHEEKGPTLRAENPQTTERLGFVQEAFEDAIDQLPNYLQEPARLYFLEEMEFDEISEEIGKAVPTVRTYKHKAVRRLRQDETLREYVDQTDL